MDYYVQGRHRSLLGWTSFSMKYEIKFRLERVMERGSIKKHCHMI